MILQLLHLFQTCETKNNYTLTPDVNKTNNCDGKGDTDLRIPQWG